MSAIDFEGRINLIGAPVKIESAQPISDGLSRPSLDVLACEMRTVGATCERGDEETSRSLTWCLHPRPQHVRPDPRRMAGRLADVIAKIVNGHPNSKIDDLLPWAYAHASALKAVA